MATSAPAGTMITGVDIFGPPTTDGKRLIAFYRDVLGLTPTMAAPDDSGAEFELADGSTFGIWEPGSDDASGKGYAALFAVGDIHAAVERFRAAGATLGDPFETSVCFISMGKDPDGNDFGIHQRKTRD